MIIFKNLVYNKTIAVTTSSILLFGGCAAVLEQNAGKIGGTTIGAGIGGAIGKEVGGDTGLLVGALIGGGIGYLIGNEIDIRRENLAKLAKEEHIEVVSQNIVQNNNQVIQKNVNEKVDSKNIIGDSFTIFSNEQQFEKNSSALNSNAEQVFSKIADQYKNSDKKILIIGHTDDSGSSEYNQKLSEDRAKNVGDIFFKKGVKKSNIYYLGAGENNPIANNNTIDGANKNRRVEIVELRNENDIVNYASKSSNLEFFRKVNPKIENNSTGALTKKNKDAIKNSQEKSKNDEKLVVESQKKEFKKLENNIISSKDIFDFNGKKVVDNNFALKTNFGESIQSNDFSLITKAQANNNSTIYQNCLSDKPRKKANAKSLDTNQPVYRTIDYKKGLNNVPFITTLSNTLIAINPISILENSSSASTFPKVSFYKDYKGEKDAKPTLELLTSVNTYQGTKGLIYRVFFEEQNTQMQCMDIVFDEKNVNSSKGVLYYTKNNQILEKEFDIARIK